MEEDSEDDTQAIGRGEEEAEEEMKTPDPYTAVTWLLLFGISFCYAMGILNLYVGLPLSAPGQLIMAASLTYLLRAVVNVRQQEKTLHVEIQAYIEQWKKDFILKQLAMGNEVTLEYRVHTVQ